MLVVVLVAKAKSAVSSLSINYKSSNDPNDQSTPGGSFIICIKSCLSVSEVNASNIRDRPILSLLVPPTHDHVVL